MTSQECVADPTPKPSITEWKLKRRGVTGRAISLTFGFTKWLPQCDEKCHCADLRTGSCFQRGMLQLHMMMVMMLLLKEEERF